MNEEENIENGIEEIIKKKRFKDKFFDFVVAVLVIVFGIGMIALIGYWYYREIEIFIESESSEYIFFYLGITTFLILTYYSAFTSSELITTLKKFFGINDLFYMTMPLIFFAVGLVFVIIINILILLLTYWFIWWSIILLILLIIILFSKTRILHKIVLTALIILTIYFLFQAKNILEFKFTTYFNSEKFFLSWK